MPRAIKGRPHLLIGVLIFILALAIRLYRLDGQGLWLDEGSSWQTAGSGWLFLARELLNPTAAYPLYHLLLKAWMACFGDSEIALRLPSAIAGALAVPVIYAAARELEQGDERESAWPRVSPYAMAAAAIAGLNPFTIWYSQEAKVYSLLLLLAALISWMLTRALRRGTRRDWLLLAGIGLLALFVHRLAGLLVLAAGWAWMLTLDRWGNRKSEIGNRKELLTVWSWPAIILASAGMIAVMALGLGSDRAATGAYIPADPLSAIGLTFTRFSLDRWPGDAPWWWLIPWALLFVWGLGRVVWEMQKEKGKRKNVELIALLCLLFVPLILFLLQLLFTHLYEARYLIVIFPAWVLVLAYPLKNREPRTENQEPRTKNREWQLRGVGLLVMGLALVSGVAALFQPRYGLFSGDPVKEQYREAIAELAQRVHPDDAVVLHPSYIRPLYDYYMARFNADPAPTPIGFADFWQGTTSYGQREWDTERHQKLAGYLRSFLLIAPEHAKTVDPPAAGTGDEYGLVGNFWAYSREQRTWPCGIWRYNGAHLLCQEAPEAYYSGTAPQPAVPSGAVFGERLRLLGVTLKATTAAGPGTYRAGGNLPISLFWDVEATPGEDYSFFLHLCQRCDVPPIAGEDGPPLEGYLPTSTWLPGKPARDDRAISLPANMAPGRYTLLLGVYRPGDPSPDARLQISGVESVDGDRLVLGTVEVIRDP